jgi:predicted nucleic acid-binding Zn ribbon protein
VVGGRLAVECLPAALEGGVLIVRASSAAWGAQIRFLEAEIRDRANRALGRPLVQELRVTIDGGGAERSR